MDKKNIEEFEKEFYIENIKAASSFISSYILYVAIFVIGAYVAFHWMKEKEAVTMEKEQKDG